MGIGDGLGTTQHRWPHGALNAKGPIRGLGIFFLVRDTPGTEPERLSTQGSTH
jgi:hypothetical protein